MSVWHFISLILSVDFEPFGRNVVLSVECALSIVDRHDKQRMHWTDHGLSHARLVPVGIFVSRLLCLEFPFRFLVGGCRPSRVSQLILPSTHHQPCVPMFVVVSNNQPSPLQKLTRQPTNTRELANRVCCHCVRYLWPAFPSRRAKLGLDSGWSRTVWNSSTRDAQKVIGRVLFFSRKPQNVSC